MQFYEKLRFSNIVGMQLFWLLFILFVDLFQNSLVLVFNKVYRETVWCWFIEKMDAKMFYRQHIFLVGYFQTYTRTVWYEVEEHLYLEDSILSNEMLIFSLMIHTR